VPGITSVSTTPDLDVAWSLSPPKHRPCEVSARYRTLDALTVGELRANTLMGCQRAGTSTADARVGVSMCLAGRLRCSSPNGRELVLDPGQLMVWDSTIAYDFEVVDNYHELYILVPRDRVPLRLVQAATRLSGAIETGPGSGLFAVAAHHLNTICGEVDHLSDAALRIACQSLLELLDHALGTLEEHSTVSVALLAKVRDYIEHNLDDVAMSPSSIAAMHDISVRTLHALFSPTGTTVSRWIRDQRLKACYQDLSRGTASTVTEVAFRWGFNDAAHFSRCFRQAFAVTPSSVLAHRRVTLGTCGRQSGSKRRAAAVESPQRRSMTPLVRDT
jgi:AraC-like DNA-binding protein